MYTEPNEPENNLSTRWQHEVPIFYLVRGQNPVVSLFQRHKTLSLAEFSCIFLHLRNWIWDFILYNHKSSLYYIRFFFSLFAYLFFLFGVSGPEALLKRGFPVFPIRL